VRVDVGAAGPTHLEVVTPAAPDSEPPVDLDGRIEIMLAGGATVRVDARVNEGALRRVLAVLERS